MNTLFNSASLIIMDQCYSTHPPGADAEEAKAELEKSVGFHKCVLCGSFSRRHKTSIERHLQRRHGDLALREYASKVEGGFTDRSDLVSLAPMMQKRWNGRKFASVVHRRYPFLLLKCPWCPEEVTQLHSLRHHAWGHGKGIKNLVMHL